MTPPPLKENHLRTLCYRAPVFKKNQVHLILLLSFLLVVFLSKLRTLNTPFYWDEIGWIRSAYWLSGENLFRALPGFHPLGTFFGHPPGLHVSMAFLFKLFGKSIWLAHFFIVCISFAGVYFTYLLGAYLFGTRVGVFAALFLFFTPMYFAQSGMYLGDVPVTTFGVMSLYFGLRKQYLPYLISSMYLVSIKETGAAIVLAFLIYLVITGYKKESRFGVEILKYSIPLWAIAAFLLLQKFTAGKFVGIYAFEYDIYKHTFAQIFEDFVLILKWIFIYQYRFLFTLLIALHFVINRKTAFRKELLLFFIVMLLATLPFSYFMFLPRYLLPSMPYLCITAAWAIFELVRSNRLSLGLSAAIVTLYGFSLAGSTSYGNNEWNMKYINIVNMHRSMCEYIETRFPRSSILAVFPFNSALSKPDLGYVSKPVRAVSLTRHMKTKCCDLVVFSYLSDRKPPSRLMQFIKQDQRLLIKRMKAENFVTELYGAALPEAPGNQKHGK